MDNDDFIVKVSSLNRSLRQLSGEELAYSHERVKYKGGPVTAEDAPGWAPDAQKWADTTNKRNEIRKPGLAYQYAEESLGEDLHNEMVQMAATGELKRQAQMLAPTYHCGWVQHNRFVTVGSKTVGEYISKYNIHSDARYYSQLVMEHKKEYGFDDDTNFADIFAEIYQRGENGLKRTERGEQISQIFCEAVLFCLNYMRLVFNVRVDKGAVTSKKIDVYRVYRRKKDGTKVFLGGEEKGKEYQSPLRYENVPSRMPRNHITKAEIISVCERAAAINPRCPIKEVYQIARDCESVKRAGGELLIDCPKKPDPAVFAGLPLLEHMFKRYFNSDLRITPVRYQPPEGATESQKKRAGKLTGEVTVEFGGHRTWKDWSDVDECGDAEDKPFTLLDLAAKRTRRNEWVDEETQKTKKNGNAQDHLNLLRLSTAGFLPKLAQEMFEATKDVVFKLPEQEQDKINEFKRSKLTSESKRKLYDALCIVKDIWADACSGLYARLDEIEMDGIRKGLSEAEIEERIKLEKPQNRKTFTANTNMCRRLFESFAPHMSTIDRIRMLWAICQNSTRDIKSDFVRLIMPEEFAVWQLFVSTHYEYENSGDVPTEIKVPLTVNPYYAEDFDEDFALLFDGIKVNVEDGDIFVEGERNAIFATRDTTVNGEFTLRFIDGKMFAVSEIAKHLTLPESDKSLLCFQIEGNVNFKDCGRGTSNTDKNGRSILTRVETEKVEKALKHFGYVYLDVADREKVMIYDPEAEKFVVIGKMKSCHYEGNQTANEKYMSLFGYKAAPSHDDTEYHLLRGKVTLTTKAERDGYRTVFVIIEEICEADIPACEYDTSMKLTGGDGEVKTTTDVNVEKPKLTFGSASEIQKQQKVTETTEGSFRDAQISDDKARELNFVDYEKDEFIF